MVRTSISIKSSRILVVDDTPANLDLFSQILESEGYQVSFATNGKDALKLASLDKPDLILLDIMMPDIDGIETCRQLKQLRDIREVPVIFITAKTDRKDVVDGFSVGAVDFITKPVQHEEVCARVRCHLQLQALIKLRDELISMLCKHNERIEALVEEQNKKILQTEKLAAIGEMVGEFTHEISTPVGIAITALSYMSEQTSLITKSFNEGTLNKEDFSAFLTANTDSVDIANNNLKRMLDLIRSFKRVTIDQCNDERVLFDLGECLADIVTSMQPKIKHTKHNIVVDCENDIMIYSYPGVFAQIVINMINNSFLHGFEDTQKGEVRLTAGFEDGALIFLISDDGKGVKDSLLDKIFDKFYTSKRGEEGSGLGLHIVKGLVRDTLGGNIICRNIVGGGCEFKIDIPEGNLIESHVEPKIKVR